MKIHALEMMKHIIDVTECRACGDKYVGEKGSYWKDRMFNHISDIRRNKNGPVFRHIDGADNICFGAGEDIILYPVEQIPDHGNVHRNKSLRRK